jgi:polyphosphate:AMP phosphotransferase
MFESALIGRKLGKKEFEEVEPRLRTDLLLAQLDLAEKRDRAVILLIAGIDGAGKARVAQRLLEWLDPRHIATKAFDLPNEVEQGYPRMQRYWAALPAKGRMCIVFGSWYHRPLYERITGKLSNADFQEEMHAIAHFEAMLASEGQLIRKLWLHLPRKQREKNGKLAKSKASARVRMREWGDIGKLDYEVAREAVETMSRITSSAVAPWVVIPGGDANYRDVLTGQVLLECLKSQKNSAAPKADIGTREPEIEGVKAPTIFDTLDFKKSTEKDGLKARLQTLQTRLHALTQKSAFARKGVVAVFEGPDAAGKGGCIRRMVRVLDPRLYQVHSIAAPSDEELAHPYLWRFWRRIPPRGKLAIFDRSWYGRVLVERVEGFCSPADWQRAYQEIVDFETELAEAGLVVVKFWLQISEDEQLSRFREREQTAFKRFKITAEDWRNRERWQDYQVAAAEMIDRTSTTVAPWSVIAAEDKRKARVEVLETLCGRLAKAK